MHLLTIMSDTFCLSGPFESTESIKTGFYEEHRSCGTYALDAELLASHSADCGEGLFSLASLTFMLIGLIFIFSLAFLNPIKNW